MEKEQTSLSLLTHKLPEELRANYNSSEHKCSAVVEGLKVAAALKLWVDRGYRAFGFGVESEDFGGKSFYVLLFWRMMPMAWSALNALPASIWDGYVGKLNSYAATCPQTATSSLFSPKTLANKPKKPPNLPKKFG